MEKKKRCQITKPQMYSLRCCQGQIWYSVLQLTIPVQTEHKSHIPPLELSAFQTCASCVQHMTRVTILFQFSHFPFSEEAAARKTRKALTWAFEPFKSQQLLYIPNTLTLRTSTYFSYTTSLVLCIWSPRQSQQTAVIFVYRIKNMNC